MKEQILKNSQNALELEKLYRANKSQFKRDFNELYPQNLQTELGEFWNQRLNYETESISWGSKDEIKFIMICILLAGLIAKFPALFNISEDFFFPRNIGFIIFPFLTAFFVWKNEMSNASKGILISISVLLAVYINFLPNSNSSDTLILACLHLPFILWGMLGYAFIGNSLHPNLQKLAFLRFNGDVAVLSVLLGIAGMLMTGMTLGLFSLIGISIEKFYFEYIAVFGLPAIPFLATLINKNNPQLVDKVSPIIAKLFSPLVLLMLIAYLSAILISGKDPYNDREFLLTFNLLLIGVMALIFFSVAEHFHQKERNWTTWILFLLAIATILVNGIALSAIIFRISEWGFTPNRTAVLGGNILILGHLMWVTALLFQSVNRKTTLQKVGIAIVQYLPIYVVWAFIVVFLFPLMFGFE